VRLTSKFLKNVDSVNAWSYTDTWVVRSSDGVGEAVSLYFQIADVDRDGIRYIPINTPAAATIQATFPNLDDTEQFIINGTFPFADDRSIVKLDLLPSQVPASGAVRFSLSENGVTKQWVVFQAITVEKSNSECC
jgi:hypothetical protein